MSEANGVGRAGGRRGPRVIHLPSPRRLLRPEPALLVAALALVGAMNAPVGVGADHGPRDDPASTTRVSVAPGPESLRWFDAAERRERGDRLRAMYAVPLPAAEADPGAARVGPVAPPGSFAVPDALWGAYTAAAAAMPEACHLDPRLLAAIGQVESGSLAGRGLDGRHRAVPPVLGPVLDGGSFASIRDTDAGRWDGDRSWDRAVGPMQFIPSTWSRHGRDADGDGVADPQDIEDAALSAAGYLCAGGRDLARPDDLRAAILSYNHSTSYLAAVLGLVPNVLPGGGDLVLAGGSGTTVAAAAGGSPSATTTATAPAPSSTTSAPTTTTATTVRPTTSSTTASPTSTASSSTSSATSTSSTTSATTPTAPPATTTTAPTVTTTTAPTVTTTTAPTATTTTAPSPTTSTSPSPTTTTPDPCGTTTSSTVSSTTTATVTTTPTPTCTATPAPSPSTSSANATEEALGAGTTPTSATTG